jgi:hypothetical protein
MAGYDIVLPIWIHFLLGGFNPSEKYESQIGSSSQLTDSYFSEGLKPPSRYNMYVCMS